MWSFPACPGSGMGRVRLDVIRFPVLPDPPRPLRWVSSETRGAYRTGPVSPRRKLDLRLGKEERGSGDGAVALCAAAECSAPVLTLRPQNLVTQPSEAVAA